MDGASIYEDLDNFILTQQVEKVQEDNKELQQTIEKLEETTKKFSEEISDLKKINQNLERNISALFKTAKSEIGRKDKQISELRKELDNLKFRRGNNKKAQKGENNEEILKELEVVKCVVEQKNRIIQSLTKELETVKKDFSNQEKNLKRNSSHLEDDDLRSRLGKKRKLDDKSEYKHDKSRRHRSRTKSRERRYDSRLKSRYDKRTIRWNRSRSSEKRRNRNENSRYSKSRSRSPASHKKYNNQSSKTSNSKHQEKINKVRSRSRSSSFERKKNHKHSEKAEVLMNGSDKHIKCEKKIIHINNLIKEDSGMSSSNSHTSELLPKCDEVKADLLEDLNVQNLEEGELDSTLEDINSEEDNVYFEEKNCLDENRRERLKDKNTKTDKNEIKKMCEGPKKNIADKSELKTIVENEIEIKPLEKEKNTYTEISIYKAPELGSELVANNTAITKEKEINDHFRNPHDVLELMVQSNYLDDLDIDEEIVKMRILENDKRKKRKEEKDRISKLRSAISECKQNIELLEHNFSDDDDSETEDEFNRTGSCVEENVVNTKPNNLVLKICKGSIVMTNVEPKTDTITLKDDVDMQKTDDVLDKNQVDISIQQKIIDLIEAKISSDVLDENPIDVEEIHIQKPEEILDKNAVETDKKEMITTEIQKPNEISPILISDANKKEISKKVENKSVKEIPKIKNQINSKDNLEVKADKDNKTKKSKSLEDDNRNKRKDTNDKPNRKASSSKEEKVEKMSSNKNTNINSTTSSDKIEKCVEENTETVELRPQLAERISDHELLEAINTIVDVKMDPNEFEQNFANITNLEGVISDGQTQKTTNVSETLESKLSEIFEVENEKKENVSQEKNDEESKTATNNSENETERKPPLKARRRRAFIYIT